MPPRSQLARILKLLPLIVPLSTHIACWAPLSRFHRRCADLPESKNTSDVHSHFMNLALKQARNAEKNGEVPIGAVIIERKEDGHFQILSQACNLVETRNDASAHAEMLALRQAANRLKNWRLANTTLYTSLEPCPMCLAAAQAFRVEKIVYGAPDLRLGAIKTHIRLLDVDHPFHTIEEVIPGVLGNESSYLLKDFFRRRREMTSTFKDSASFRARLRRLLTKLRF